MTISLINWLNIFFMIVAAVMAVKLPFETFLFSYAVLGPLHYVTEINWLNQKKYFLKDTDQLFFKIVSVVGLFFLTICSLHAANFYLNFMSYFKTKNWLIDLFFFTAPLNDYSIFMSLWVSLTLVFVKKWQIKVVSILVGLIVGILFFAIYQQTYITYFMLFVPTIIHVWIFTGIFILSGAIKSKSFSGWLSMLVYLLVSYLLFDIHPDIYGYKPSKYVVDSYFQSNFMAINSRIFSTFFDKNSSNLFVWNSEIGLQIQSLIAFAYTYHYLNWFSKTSIIKWHQINRSKMVLLLLIWATSLLIYSYDYKVGLAVLYFISVLHVILEFPLNILVIKEIAQNILSVFRRDQIVKSTPSKAR